MFIKVFRNGCVNSALQKLGILEVQISVDQKSQGMGIGLHRTVDIWFDMANDRTYNMDCSTCSRIQLLTKFSHNYRHVIVILLGKQFIFGKSYQSNQEIAPGSVQSPSVTPAKRGTKVYPSTLGRIRVPEQSKSEPHPTLLYGNFITNLRGH